MTGKQMRLVRSFTHYEIVRGYRSFKKIKYFLKIYFSYLALENLAVRAVRHQEAQNFQTYLSSLTDEQGQIRYAVRTVLDILNVVSNFYRYLKKRGDVYTNPFHRIKLLRLEKRLPKHIPDEKQLCFCLSRLKEFWKCSAVKQARAFYRTHVIAELLYATGLRLDELARLKVDEIDFCRGLVLVRQGKGGKERYAYLTEYAQKVVRLYIEEMRDLVNKNAGSDHLFGVKDGKSLDSSLNQHLNEIGEACGLKHFTSHYFRHCIGYHFLRRGCDIRYIQLILGHESLNTTVVYTQVDKSGLRNELDRYHPRT